jgi:hypothetical protein
MNDCKHMTVTTHLRLYAAETLHMPAEYVGVAECNECGEILDLDDIPDDAEVEEAKQRISFTLYRR